MVPGGRATEFYLAQIDAEHAGKTMVIKLWDPGDTGQLAANLQEDSWELEGVPSQGNARLATPLADGRAPRRTREVNSVHESSGLRVGSECVRN